MARDTGYGQILATCIALAAACAAPPADAQLRANRRPPRPTVTLPEGPVRHVILESCSACHGIDEYGYYAMDRAHWNSLIERMKTAKSGVVEGTVISDADKALLLDWLVAEFGPDSTPMPREYVVRELEPTERLGASQANLELESACTSCHTLERVYAADLDAAEWRERVTREIGRGAALLIADAEPLVQWLSETE